MKASFAHTPPSHALTACAQDTYTSPKITSYKVTDAIATAPDPNVLVVRYNVTANETLHGLQLVSGARPRLTVFVRGEPGGTDDTSWKLLRWARTGMRTLLRMAGACGLSPAAARRAWRRTRPLPRMRKCSPQRLSAVRPSLPLGPQPRRL